MALQMKAQLELFRENLAEFASKHRKDIARNPEFRMQFQKMCAQIGVDPLACTPSCGHSCHFSRARACSDKGFLVRAAGCRRLLL